MPYSSTLSLSVSSFLSLCISILLYSFNRFLFIYLFFWGALTFIYLFIFKLYNIVLVLPNIEMNLPQVYLCSTSWTLFPPPSPYPPSGLSQCTGPKHPVSCIKPGLATHFIHDIIHVSMPFSHLCLNYSALCGWFSKRPHFQLESNRIREE